MRVITGTARGMSLVTLEGETTRPTTEKVKEAVFSAIQFEIEGRKVLDLFAGSGQMGIEALSRGAESAVFVDSDKNAVKIIKENITKTGMEKYSQVAQMDAFSFLRMNVKKFDLVFLDPPYSAGALQKALDEVEPFVNDGGTVICEHPFGEEMPETVGALSVYRSYKYSKTAVTIYRKD